ncbi:CHAT domain-containing protein [Pseudoneurospora amorphoporcata]|uniref:CHAT domain-containing protein n=1 Tax=Pseudoneurospora amorphoporcata TaxID=241081 RepID=A0AAN6SB85_9PEZI|nr:CHAT domain-containing protein [Pseudoneurospora amorphoporcata]
MSRRIYRQALEATPEDHPDRTHRLHSLGLGYRDRYQRTGAVADLELAIQHFKEAVVHSSSAILDRLRPAMKLLQLPLKTKHWELADEVASTAVSLIPLLTPRSLENSDKQYLLTKVSGLASDAAAVVLMVGKTPYKAMQLLELGRGVIIVDQFIMPTVVPNQVNQRYDAGQKLEELIDDIRRLPGFDRFLMGPTEDELKAAAISGPIVTINVSNYRCDTLIIEEHGLKSVPLPDLKRNDIEARAKALVNLDAQLLEWLWDTIAKPVLDALGFTQKPNGALVQSRQKHSTLLAERGSGKAVLIGIEKTSGLADLAFVSQEIKELKRICGSMQLQVLTLLPFQKDVMAALKDCDIFHFAGYGSTNQSDPSKSSLLLKDGPLTVASLFETNLQSRMPFLAYLSACGTGQVKHDKLMDEALHLVAAYQIAGFRHVIGTLWEVNDALCVDAATGIYKWMQDQKMTDDSVSEGLHRVSIKLRKAWLLENETRAANRMAALRNKSVPMDTEHTRSSQGTTKDLRAVELYEDAPLHWVPYVHFGI